MIKSIELINWKTHKHTVMNFQNGVNVLVGVMGAGKSSVIDGISYGLFGTFPSLNQRRTTSENLISNRPSVEDNAEVRIKFTIDSDEYTVSRKITRKESGAAKLEKNGDYLQTQSVRVNEEIENIIKIDYDTFSRAIYAEQNRIAYFLELTKSERKKQIDQMLGLDSFAIAETNATSLINNIKSLIADEEQVLAQADAGEIKLQLEKLVKEKQGIDKDQLQLTEESKQKESNIKKLEKELVEVKAKYDRSKKLEKEIAELSGKIETLNKELKKIEEMGINKEEIESNFILNTKKLEEHNSEIKQLRKNESQMLKLIADADALVKFNEKKAIERDKLLESIKGKDPKAIEEAVSQKDAGLQNSIKELSSLKGKQEDVKKWASELTEHISKCPVCERELDERMRALLLEQKNASLKELDSGIKKLDEEIKKLEKELVISRKDNEAIKLATTKLNDYKEINEIIEKNSAALKEHTKKHTALTSEMEKHNKEAESLNKQLSEINLKREAAKRKEKYDIDIKESSEKLEKTNKEAKEINYDEKNLYKLQELITKETSLLSEVSGKIKSNERYVKGVDTQIEERTKTLANLSSIQEKIDSKRNNMSNMNKFRTALVETEAQLRNNLVTSINSLMQNIWPELYPYADYESIRLNAKADDYSLEACTGMEGDQKKWVEIDGIASGGERSVACLTMRIALAMVIVPNLRWLILDEPTHNIDENGISKFIEVLGNSLPKVVEQIFIITHDNALKNITSARVYTLERNKDKNEYTSVVES
jgi:DNA repair protein SbcC/Rad50